MKHFNTNAATSSFFVSNKNSNDVHIQFGFGFSKLVELSLASSKGSGKHGVTCKKKSVNKAQ